MDLSVMEPLFSSLLFLMLLPRSSRLYSLHSCTMDSTDPQNIYCDNNELSRIPPGIPTSAVFLTISFNNIESIHQSDFCGLSELQTLDLSENQISDIEDAAFSHLSSLTKLRLSNNCLCNLTDHMFSGLSNLTDLDLGFNQITSVSEFAFAPLTKLQKIDLSGNLLSSTRDLLKLSFCPLLKVVDLSANNLLASFDSEQFPSPLNITDLDLTLIPLRSFSLHSDVLPHLHALHLSASELQWNVSDKAFLKSLRTLGLGFDSIFDVETYQLIFQSLDSLENLVLSYIKHLDRRLLDWACGIQTLETLYLWTHSISVLNDSLLLPCSNLSELDLSLNDLSDFAPSSLQMLTRLSRLNLGYNDLTKVPLTIRNMSSLTFLSLRHNRVSKLSCSDFSNLHSLTELDLSHNKLSELNSCVFQDLQSLQKLSIEKNSIIHLHSLSLPNLLVFIANINNIWELKADTFKTMALLTDLQLQSETGTNVDVGTFDGLTDLTNLTLSVSGINESPSWCKFCNLSSLQRMELDIKTYAFCLSWSRDSFRGLNNLKVMTLHTFFCESPDPELFSHTPHLLNLEITDNKDWIPVPELFQPLSVLQTLDLSRNHLKSLDFLSESNLTQLQTLILQNNDLSVIDVRALEALPSLRHLDLSENMFVCDCSNTDFILWAVNNRRVFVDGAFQYSCAFPPSHQGAILLDFHLLWCWESGFPCFLLNFALIFLWLLSSFFYIFFRFHLLYGFYLLRAALFHRQKLRRGCEEIYDAFVSYSAHDEDWVYRELVPELEERQGWKLCLHHRDFTPGRFVLDNITEAIYSSRKTLCVISREYLHSQWCSHEIQMASYRLFDEQKDVLVLVLLEELSANQLGPFFRIRKLLKSRTYVSWSGARGHRALFWERVRRALQSGAQPPTDGHLPTINPPRG